MTFITNIKRRFLRLFKKPHDIFKDSRYVIKYEEALGCYYFDDVSNMPYERGLQAITFFTELSENCTKEVMKEFHTAIGKCFQGTKIDISQLVLIHKVLGDRLYKLPPSPALIMRLASVVYFDKDENPTTYDSKYNLEKIERWKKEFPNGSFFFATAYKEVSSLFERIGREYKNIPKGVAADRKYDVGKSFIATIGASERNRAEQSRLVIAKISHSRPEWTTIWEYFGVLDEIIKASKQKKPIPAPGGKRSN